jgi:hypothetical protein
MGNYLTICCDSRPIAIEEKQTETTWLSSGDDYLIYVIGLCPNCDDWYECRDDEDLLDWSDEIEYIYNHLGD